MVGFLRASTAASAVPAAAVAHSPSPPPPPPPPNSTSPCPPPSPPSPPPPCARRTPCLDAFPVPMAAATDLSAPGKYTALPELTPLGDLGTLEAGENGEAHFSGLEEKMKVLDLIGRSIALYATEDRSDSGISAAMIASSSGVGENYKKLCTCDGVTIWESS